MNLAESVPVTEQELARAMAGNPIFAPCSSAQFELLGEAASLYEARRGERIADAGTPFPFLGLTLDGVIAVTATADGEVRSGVRHLRLYEAYAGSTFCEISFLDGYQALGEITVVSKHARYALFPSFAVMQAAESDPHLLQRLAIHAAARCRELKRRLVAQAAHPVTARVAGVLLPFASEDEGLSPVDPQLVEFAQRDIAAAAGCVKEAAARAIAQLEAAGALRRHHGRIRYLDRARLMEFADGLPAKLVPVPRRGGNDRH